MPGGSRACSCTTGAILWWILQTGAVMSLVRFGDPLGPLSKASLPFVRQGKPQQAPNVMVGASLVSGAVSQGRSRRQCVLDSERRNCEDAMGGGGEVLVASTGIY
jgi:hypothetical protein